MENEKPTLPVSYHREKVSVAFSECQSAQPGSPPHQSPPQRTETRRCNAKRICKIALPVGAILVIAAVVLAMFFFDCFAKSKSPSGRTESADTALPEVTNLNISAISDDSFTVSWQRPQGAFDNYIVEVTYIPKDHDDDNYSDSEEQSVGSCLPVTLMSANETSITCNNVPACSNATVTVLTQSDGTRQRTSQGVSLPIFIDGGALPEVKNLDISAISDDSFTVSWQRPQGTFDKYIVEVAYIPEDHDDDNSTDSEEQSVGSCPPMTLMNANETSITCNNVPACSNATVTVLTQSNGIRPRTSQGVSLPIFIHGGAPEEFRLSLAYLDFTSVDVLIDVSNVSSCQLGSCYAELQHPSMVKKKLQCDFFSETHGTVRLRGLTTGTPYKCMVSIQNPYSFKQAEKMIDITAR